jgi:hypothetical protein
MYVYGGLAGILVPHQSHLVSSFLLQHESPSRSHADLVIAAVCIHFQPLVVAVGSARCVFKSDLRKPVPNCLCTYGQSKHSYSMSYELETKQKKVNPTTKIRQHLLVLGQSFESVAIF